MGSEMCIRDRCGTYRELMDMRGDFFNTMQNYGMLKEDDDDAEDLAAEAEDERRPPKKFNIADVSKPGAGKTMESEERNTGSVDGYVYASYLRAGQWWWVVPIVLTAGSCMQASTNLSSYWIVWWERWTTDPNDHQSTGFSAGLYAMLGILQLIFNFIMDVALGLMTFLSLIHI